MTDQPKPGTLTAVSKYGVRNFMYYECADCATMYPRINGAIRCNGFQIYSCPYCRLEVAPHGCAVPVTIASTATDPVEIKPGQAWNTRFVEFARAMGRTPEEQHSHCKSTPGVMTNFVLWNTQRLREFGKDHPNAMCYGSLIDHPVYDEWLGRWVDNYLFFVEANRKANRPQYQDAAQAANQDWRPSDGEDQAPAAAPEIDTGPSGPDQTAACTGEANA